MPTILILTANNSDNPLDKLAQEGKEIQRALNSVYGKEYDVALVSDAGVADLIAELTLPNRAVEVLHLAGHADSRHFLFSDKPADALDLAEKLRLQGTLKFVFINGCATKGQVSFFLQAGIPHVFATSCPVEDGSAYWVATQFYRYLTLGRSIREARDEVMIDGAKLLKNIKAFRPNRATGFEPSELSDEGPVDSWDLYNLPEALDYSIPINWPQDQQLQPVSHTSFLNQLVFTLAKVQHPRFTVLSDLKTAIQRGSVSDDDKLVELFRVMPYTLSYSLRKIVAKPGDQSGEYYRELLYRYAFFFDILLHHTVALLFSGVWQEKSADLENENEYKKALRDFLKRDILDANPQRYVTAIEALNTWRQTMNINNAFPGEPARKEYLGSSSFKEAGDFFYLQKQYYRGRVRLKNEEAIEKCSIAQKYIEEAFEHFYFIAQYVMVLIRGINVINFRHMKVEFDNSVARLLGDQAYTRPLTFPEMLENKSVLCFDTPDFNPQTPSLNLFPFVIDRNVFTGKSNDVPDIYLYCGYFPHKEQAEKPYFHYVSIQHLGKVWCFDDTEDQVSLKHMDEIDLSESQEREEMTANIYELRRYLQEFKSKFLSEN